MRRAVLDSNAVDSLLDLPGAYEAVRAALDAGRVELLFTHVSIDELAAVPDDLLLEIYTALRPRRATAALHRAAADATARDPGRVRGDVRRRHVDAGSARTRAGGARPRRCR